MPYPYSYDYDEKVYAPVKLKTDRSMWKLMIFSILTLGVYTIVFFIPFSFDLDKIHPKRDGTKTMNYIWAFVLSIFTYSIVMLIWHHQIAERIEEALKHNDIDYEFEVKDFWLWYFLGSFVLVGPFVYMHKLCKAMNLLCEHYNANLTVR